MMAAEAALFAGCWSAATRTSQQFLLAVQKLWLGRHDVDVLRELISRATVVLLGPGLGIGEWGRLVR